MRENRHEWIDKIDIARRGGFKPEAFNRHVAHVRQAQRRWSPAILGNVASENSGEDPEIFHQQLRAVTQDVCLVIMFDIRLHRVDISRARVTQATLRVVVIDPISPVRMAIYDCSRGAIPNHKALSHGKTIGHVDEVVGASERVEIDIIPGIGRHHSDHIDIAATTLNCGRIRCEVRR